jgi:hypothetical protein
LFVSGPGYILRFDITNGNVVVDDVGLREPVGFLFVQMP